MLGINHIKISHKLLMVVCQIDEVKGLWKGLETHTTSLKRIADIAVFGSAFETALTPLKEQKIEVQTLKVLHAGLNKEKTPSNIRNIDHPLKIYDLSNDENRHIGTLDTASPEDILPILEKLLDWIDITLREKTLHPLIAIAIFSAVYLQIMPFENKNHKLLHTLITAYMLKAGYRYGPYISLAPYIKDRGEKMFRALSDTQESLESGAPNWDKWLMFFMGLYIKQANGFIRKVYGKTDELFHLPTLSQKVLTLFDTHERLSMKDIINLTNGRRSTLKLRLGELVNEGYLKRHGQARATWYGLV